MAQTHLDLSAGRLTETGGITDFALLSGGFFVVRASDGALFCTRNGQFQRADDGRLITAGGEVLQAEGGDLVLRGGRLTVSPDGVVLEDGEPRGRIDVVASRAGAAPVPVRGGLYSLADADATPAEAPRVRQGALETSNVSAGDEMVLMMAALRRAEAGQRLANTYDDLLGRAVATFGQG